jgi:carboxyl-terminal processing protease
VGVKTYGTGTVLGEFPLADGSALRVGTVEWLTPKGRRIWHEGIVPDVVVERAADVAPLGPNDIVSMTAAQIAELSDPQLARALSVATAAATPPA